MEPRRLAVACSRARSARVQLLELLLLEGGEDVDGRGFRLRCALQVETGEGFVDRNPSFDACWHRSYSPTTKVAPEGELWNMIRTRDIFGLKLSAA